MKPERPYLLTAGMTIIGVSCIAIAALESDVALGVYGGWLLGLASAAFAVIVLSK